MNDPTIHGQVRAHIKACYQEHNKVACPWDGSEASALTKAIKACPAWEVDVWMRCIGNYFHSYGTNGARPRVWIPRLSDYVRGPLNKYGKVEVNESRESTFERALRRANESPNW